MLTHRLLLRFLAIVLKNNNTTISEIEACMQEWLRRSGDRIRALLKK